MDFLSRGISEIIEKEALEAALRGKKKLRVKFGIDPTSPDLHLGHTVPLRKLKQFQDAGHQVVLVIGDFTAQVGDPSGRDKTRPMLTEKQIRANLKTYLVQAGKILNLKKSEIHYNSKWFSKKPAIIYDIASRVTLQRVIERDDFQKRIKGGQDITMLEVLYPLLQGYDSVMVKADVELGGTDQKFNLLMGRRIQRSYAMPEQNIITLPLLVGTDGVQKMSKSYNNYIGITEHPEIMFGKIMSIPDSLIDSYYELCTDVKRIQTDPRQAKLVLAMVIVGMYYGEKIAVKAHDEFIRVVSHKEMPTEIPTIKIGIKSLMLADLLVNAKLAASKSEARRLIEQGGVKIGQERQSDPNKMIHLEKEIVLQVGKHKFLRVTF
ncbi:MAG TPA: tyrosine--tRNA ligase [Candidatus Paceibacterota bacterium]